jgi:hypothetical protein
LPGSLYWPGSGTMPPVSRIVSKNWLMVTGRWAIGPEWRRASMPSPKPALFPTLELHFRTGFSYRVSSHAHESKLPLVQGAKFKPEGEMNGRVLFGMVTIVPAVFLLQASGSPSVAVINFDRVVAEAPGGRDAITKLNAFSSERGQLSTKSKKKPRTCKTVSFRRIVCYRRRPGRN